MVIQLTYYGTLRVTLSTCIGGKSPQKFSILKLSLRNKVHVLVEKISDIPQWDKIKSIIIKVSATIYCSIHYLGKIFQTDVVVACGTEP